MTIITSFARRRVSTWRFMSPVLMLNLAPVCVGTIVRRRGETVMYLEKQKPSLLVSVFLGNETGHCHY